MAWVLGGTGEEKAPGGAPSGEPGEKGRGMGAPRGREGTEVPKGTGGMGAQLGSEPGEEEMAVEIISFSFPYYPELQCSSKILHPLRSPLTSLGAGAGGAGS
jgi:hypothetical protein